MSSATLFGEVPRGSINLTLAATGGVELLTDGIAAAAVDASTRCLVNRRIAEGFAAAGRRAQGTFTTRAGSWQVRGEIGRFAAGGAGIGATGASEAG